MRASCNIGSTHMHILCSAASAAGPRGVFIQSAREQTCVVVWQGAEALNEQDNSHIYILPENERAERCE